MRDIHQYVEAYGLEHITTGDILVEALEKQYISEDEGNNIWVNMIAKNRKLPNDTFTEFLKGKMP
jgi:predicted nucleic acid-binding protein